MTPGVLDPEQNSKFNDHYVEIPRIFPRSTVVYCLQMMFREVPRPLLDRMNDGDSGIYK